MTGKVTEGLYNLQGRGANTNTFGIEATHGKSTSGVNENQLYFSKFYRKAKLITVYLINVLL